MPTQRHAMDAKPDGGLYSRVTRRCVALLKHMRVGSKFELRDMAEDIRATGYPEFRIWRDGKFVQMRSARIRDYLSYLGVLGLITGQDRQYSLELNKPGSDAHWAQALSDVAREHLSKQVGKEPSSLPQFLETVRRGLHRRLRVPTIAAVLSEAGVEGARNEEIFRWSMYLYTDGDASPFEVRRYPHIARKGGE